ncbi:WD repeat [Cryptosporidium sp. chipmunk genotype I]|uniref:WD repeat n=1 Tax=Cryptosporidium sp. chipmunk genotype I TaxID=1280935 RepID=UPI00351AA513|nr:WD repeat [Cryptosporidium sp. chipmunk genotype I]
MRDCVEENGTNGVQSLIKTFVKEDPSFVILQSIKGRDNLELTDGRLLVSHNPKLIANLTTEGKVFVFLDTFKSDIESSDTGQKDIVLKEIELKCLKERSEPRTVISEAIWCKSIIREDDLREYEIAPTLVLLEKTTENIHKYSKCKYCSKHSGKQFLTILQFTRIGNFENGEYEIVELDVKDNSENGLNFNKPISIDFETSKSQKANISNQARTKIRHCRIQIKDIFSKFFNKKAEFSEGHKVCKGCFSYNSVQIFVDNSMESGFVVIMANMVVLSLDFIQGCSLILNRRFLIQDFRDPTIRFYCFIIQSGWLVSLSDNMELLIWNYCQGIAFRMVKLSEDYFELPVSNKERVDTLATLSFGKDLSKLFLVLDDLSQNVSSHPKQVGIFVIDLNVIFSQVLCSYCILKFLIDTREALEMRISDPGIELKKKLQISSGSIPHVQLYDEYSSLTVYPEAFRFGDEHKALEKIMQCLSEESCRYLDSTDSAKGLNLKSDLTKYEFGWPLLFNRSWFSGDLFCNYKMNKIIISTIENIIAKNTFGECFIDNFEELSNNTYLEAISSPLKKALESVPELIFSEAVSPRKITKNHSYRVRDMETDESFQGKSIPRKSSFIHGHVITIPTDEFENHERIQHEIRFIDIIASSHTVLIQLSIRDSPKHLSFYISEENKQLFIHQLSLESEYSMIIMGLSRVIDWHYFVLKDVRRKKSYLGLFSKTMSLLGLIYSSVRYQDIDNLHKICEYNNVNSCIIPLIQLEIGFKHEELKLISLSLKNTPMILNIEIVKLAQKMLQDANLHLSLDFKRESSKLFLDFCLDKIKYYSENEPTVFEEEKKRQDSKVDEFLQEISYYLSVFRMYLNKTSGLTFLEEVEENRQKEDENSENEFIKELSKGADEDRNYYDGVVLSKKNIFIRDQVIMGRYSSLIDWYLKSSKDKNPQVFRIKVLHEIYKLICTLSTNSLTLSIHMLRQIGENTTRYLKSILYYTSRREIRKRLISHLRHFGALDDDDIALIQFNTELESYYPNNCYSVERNRIWTSLFTYSIPYNILSDCNLESEFKANTDNECIIQEKIEDGKLLNDCFDSSEDLDNFYFYGSIDQGNHVNNPIFSAMTYPFGGLQALKSGLKINEEFNPQYLEDLRRITSVTSISAKKLSNNKDIGYRTENKENIEITNREFFYSNFSTEAISAWEDLKCCEIEDYDLELNNFYIQGGSNEPEIENDRISGKNMNTVISSIPEQEGNDYIRLNNGKLVSIKNSSCKQCLDLNEDEELEIEEELLNYENEFGQLLISRNNTNENFSLSSQKKHISSNSPNILTPSPISSSLDKNQPNTTNFGDHNSKRGDLTWLRLQRQRKEMMNNNFNNSGYLNHSLKFLSEWSFDISIRVVIEKTHLQVCFIWNRLLRGFQTPPRRNEALVYSLLNLIIKKTARQISNKLDYGICLEAAKKITTSIYIAVFGFIFSHFEWKNIPASINYLDNTLFLMLKYFNVEESYKYELVNEIISLNFKSSPSFIVEVFLNSLDSSGIIPIHHLKADLLQEKINQIEIDRYKNIKYIIDKCTRYGDYGVYLFRYYLMRSSDFASKESLNTFLSVIENSIQTNNAEENQRSQVDYTDYLNIIYIYLDKKQDIILLSLKQTFKSLKSSIDKNIYISLLSDYNGNDFDLHNKEMDGFDLEKFNNPGFILNILIKYFNNHYESLPDQSEGDNKEKSIDQLEFKGKDKRINISPYYILSILFSLDIPRKDVYNQEFYLFLDKFFPSLLQVFRKTFLKEKVFTDQIQDNSINKMNEDANEDLNSDSSPSFNITKIIKMTDKDSEPLIKMMELYPKLRKTLQENPNSTNEFFELFSENLKKVTEEEVGRCFEIPEDKLSLPILHYVSMGRPFFAFNLLCMRHTRFHNGLDYKQFRQEDLKFPELSMEEKVEIYQSVYTLAIRNFTRDTVVCSSVIFISMLKLPTELLCTDIRVARCIYIHQIHKRDEGSITSKVNYDTQEMDIQIDLKNSGKINEIWNLFLKFGPPKISSYLENNNDYNDQDNHKEFQDNQKYSSSLFSVLKMLEEAAWASGDIITGVNNKEENNSVLDQNNQDVEHVDLLPHTPIWHLVATFCRIHGLPRSLTLLHELARRGEWVAFLQECDSQKCPLETVGNIINEYMSENPVLKLHLKIALNINDDGDDVQVGSKSEFSYESNKESDYIINLVRWDKLFYSLKLVDLESKLDEKKILEFYEWSIKQVFKEIIQEMSVNRVIIYYSLLEEHYLDLIEKFPNLKSKLKELINSSVNSYLLIELVNSLCYNSIKDNIESFQDHEIWKEIFKSRVIQGFEDRNDSKPEMENLKKLLQEFVFTIFKDNNFDEILNSCRNRSDQIKQNCETDTDTDEEDVLAEDKRDLLLNRFVEETKDVILIMNELKIFVSSDSLDLLFRPRLGNISDDDTEKDNLSSSKSEQIGPLINKDETTIVLWILLSNLNESGLLCRVSSLFYGKDTQITMIFNSIEALYSYDVEKATENLNKVLICNEIGLEKDRRIIGFLPRRDLVRNYFEQEFLGLYGKITVEDHRTLWMSLSELNLENKYPKNETLFFEIENHGYRRHVIDLLYLNLEDYQVSFEQFENWLCVPEKMLLRDFYQQKRYRLFLRYLEESSSSCRTLLNDEEVLNWLEGSFLSNIAGEFEIFSADTSFKSPLQRMEFIKNYFWTELKNLSISIQKISIELTPLFLFKISIYCWYLFEKLERWLSTFDQVVLISISIHFIFEILEIMDLRKSESFKATSSVGKDYSDCDDDYSKSDNHTGYEYRKEVEGARSRVLEFVPNYFDKNYVQECLRYASYKLFLLLLSNVGIKELKQNKVKVILQGLSELISQGEKNKLEITNFEFEYNSQYFDLLEEIFLSSRGNPVIFTPSGYFNFKNVTTELPFSIQIPSKISLVDHPVDSKNVHNSVQNIVNYMFDIGLAFNVGMRFIPNMRNKLEVSKQRFYRKLKIFTQKLYSSDSKSTESSSSSDSNTNSEIANLENTPASSSINLSRSLQAWDLITDYLIEIYYISSIFTRVILIWLIQSFSTTNLDGLIPKEFENSKSSETNDFNEFLIKSIRNSESSSPCSKSSLREGSTIFWRGFILAFGETEELSLFNVTYRMKLQSILTLLQFASQVDQSSKSKYSYYIESIKEIFVGIVQNSGLSESHLNGELSSLESFDEQTLLKISLFILKVFSSNAIIPFFKEILELSIFFEYDHKDYEHNFGNSTTCTIKFKTIQKCIKVILINNAYIEKQQVDNMFIELIKRIIERFHNQPFITSILYQICQLIMNPDKMIESLTEDVELNQVTSGNGITKIRESIYLHLTRYYLVMIDFHEEGVSKDDEYSQLIINDAISKIDKLLTQHSKQEFDLVLFTNILLEIPEIPSLDELTSSQINQVLMNLELDSNEGTLQNFSSHILPSNWIRVLISQRILSIYKQREIPDKANNIFGLYNKPNINLIGSKLNEPDLLAEFLVKKCLSSQWKTGIDFMYSKYGQFDLMIALQTLIESCELLRFTDNQQSFRVYQNLAGLFSMQLYFASSYSRIKNSDFDSKSDNFKIIPGLPNNGIIGQEAKKSVYDRLTCIVRKEELDQLFEDLYQTNNNNNNIFGNRTSTQRDKYRFETDKIRLLNLDLVELYEVVSDPQVCYNPAMILVILNGYEAIYGPIVHSVWPRILFIQSIILARFKFLDDYKLEFGALDEDILLSMIRLYNNSLKEDNGDNLKRINGMTFYDFIKSEDNNNNNAENGNIVFESTEETGGVELDGHSLNLDHDSEIDFNKELDQNSDLEDDHSPNIYDLALSWNERGTKEKLSSMRKEEILENWTRLIQNYIEDLQLRISVCRMVDEEGLSEVIFSNKKLYNDKSLYKFTLTSNVDC